MNIWYLKHPTSKYYDCDVKSEARKHNAKILDFKFMGDNEQGQGCPIEKGLEPIEKKPKRIRRTKAQIEAERETAND